MTPFEAIFLTAPAIALIAALAWACFLIFILDGEPDDKD